MNSLIQNKEMDITFMELDVMMEMVEYKYRMNKLNAKIKVLTENGTHDDLMYLYEEAENEQKEEKQGVISSIIEAIKSIISSITETIKGFFNKNKDKDKNEEIEVNGEDFKNTENFIKDFETVKNKIANPSSINEDDEESVESSLNNLLKYLAFGGAGVAAVAGAATMIKITRAKQEETGEKLNGINSFFSGIIDTMGKIPFLGGIIKIIQKIVAGIQKALSKIGIFSDKNNEIQDGNNDEEEKDDVGTKVPTKISNKNYQRFLDELVDSSSEAFDTIEKYKDYMKTFKKIIDTTIIDTIDAKIGVDNNVDTVVININDIKSRIVSALIEGERIFKNTNTAVDVILENFDLNTEVRAIKDQYRSGDRKVKNDVIAKPNESEIAMLSNEKFKKNYYEFIDLCNELNYPKRYMTITNYNTLRSIYNIQKVQKVELKNPVYPPIDWLRQELNDAMRDSEGKIHDIDNGSNNELYHKLSKEDMIKYNDYVKWMKKNHPKERATVINFLATDGDYFSAENEAKRQMDALVGDYNNKTGGSITGGLKSMIQGFKNKLTGNKKEENKNENLQ